MIGIPGVNEDEDGGFYDEEDRGPPAPIKPTRPTHVLMAKPMNGQKYSIIGAAWPMPPFPGSKDKGPSYRITLNPGVRISWDDELYFTIRPNNPKE